MTIQEIGLSLDTVWMLLAAILYAAGFCPL